MTSASNAELSFRASATDSYMKPSVSPSPRMSVNRIRAGGHRISTVVSTFRMRSNSVEALIFEVRSAFDPNSKFIQLWHQILLLCLLYEVMVIPFLLTFKTSSDKWLTPELMVVYGCEGLFAVDIYVELNTGYYEGGNVLRDAKKSRLKYIKSARFALDMLALPPLSLEQVFVDNIKLILYGQGEIVYRQGDYASGIFFLLEGEVCMIMNGGAPRSVSQGGFFGTAALRLEDSAANYCERVTAISGCILLFVSREHLHALQATFSTITDALRSLEKRLLDPKLAKASVLDTGSNHLIMVERHPILEKLFGACLDFGDIVCDPDSVLILAWETYVFIAMTAQWILVMFNICFGVPPEYHTSADTLMGLIEASFLIDMFVRSHLGFYEFGNKVMDSVQIKKRYFCSREFVIDGLALLPLFLLSWVVDHDTRRWELFNLNKLIRLLKVPSQFTALENKYLKFTLELRLFKLVYYTFLLSHTFGCIWFDFASHASGVRELVGVADESDSSFGAAKWYPPKSLENGTLGLQYFASLFWSFGLMSASSPGELPKTVSQSLCCVITMTFGFFLFAYAIGNFLDTIELVDAENREFYAKLSSLRHLMSHFQLPGSIQEKFKAYFFFKRFHSITVRMDLHSLRQIA